MIRTDNAVSIWISFCGENERPIFTYSRNPLPIDYAVALLL